MLINTVLGSTPLTLRLILKPPVAFRCLIKSITSVGLIFIIHTACANPTETPLITYSYQVIQQFPHSNRLFTQGLEFDEGFLYESGGLYGQSTLIKRTLESTQPLIRKHIDSRYFAEGITLLNDKIYQLTWRSKTVFVYDKKTFKQINQFKLSGEGWGLSNNGKLLILSNGSNQLQFIDPENFNTVNTIAIQHNSKTIDQLNELEWVNGLIYANIWQTSSIAIINPENGQLLGKVHLDTLVAKAKQSPGADVLNGIAYDKTANRLLITGKYWSHLYHIEITPPPSSKNIKTNQQ